MNFRQQPTAKQKIVTVKEMETLGNIQTENQDIQQEWGKYKNKNLEFACHSFSKGHNNDDDDMAEYKVFLTNECHGHQQ